MLANNTPIRYISFLIDHLTLTFHFEAEGMPRDMIRESVAALRGPVLELPFRVTSIIE